MKKGIVLFTIFALFLATIPLTSNAEKYEFNDVVSIIKATRIDGISLFDDPQNGSLEEDSPLKVSFEHDIKGGALLTIFIDEPRNWLLLFEENSYNLTQFWGEYNIKGSEYLPSILSTILQDYIDYENGACFSIAFSDFWHDHEIIRYFQYSPYFNEADSIITFTDNEKFCDYISIIISNLKELISKSASLEETIDFLNDSKEPDFFEQAKYSLLQKGDKGELVMSLQNRLNDLEYSVGTVDGVFGNKTKAAIEDFQSDNNLPITGIADQKTQELLFSDSAKTKEEQSLERGLKAMAEILTDGLDTNGDGEIDFDEMFVTK